MTQHSSSAQVKPERQMMIKMKNDLQTSQGGPQALTTGCLTHLQYAPHAEHLKHGISKSPAATTTLQQLLLASNTDLRHGNTDLGHGMASGIHSTIGYYELWMPCHAPDLCHHASDQSCYYFSPLI
jgi:hypothetical protein